MRSESATEREAYSVTEVAAMLGVGKDTVWQRVRSGQLPSIKFGSRVLVPRSVLDCVLAGGLPQSGLKGGDRT